MQAKRKVYAYIVQDQDIVVFEHPHAPEAGVQVPGGTVEADETLAAAVLREAFEETGLVGLTLVRYLGKHERDMRDYGKDEYHERHFYQLTCANPIPQRWQHYERHSSESSANDELFAFYRVPLAQMPPLVADFDIFIPALRRLLLAEN